MLGNGRDIEDVAQETFLRLWVNAKKWDPGKAKLSTWLHRIAHNLCIDLLRKQQRVLLGERFDEELDSNSNFDSSLRNAVVEQAKEDPSSQQMVEKDSELSALNMAISKLPETTRDTAQRPTALPLSRLL